MDQTDRDRLDTLLADALEHGPEARVVKRRLHRAVPAQTFDDLHDVAPRDESRRLVVAQRVELLPVVARNRVRVAQPPGHDQQHAGALALEERVQANGRAVDDELDLARRGNELAQAVEHAAGGVGGCRQNLPR